jgi:dienelactone hydrolase
MLKSWLFIFTILLMLVVAISAILIVFKRSIKQMNEKANKNIIIDMDKKEDPDYYRPERIILNTDDGVEIVADYSFVEGSKFAGLLLHMMPADRKSYLKFSQELNKNGWTTLSIDLRGHGESVSSDKGRLDYRKFSDKEHQASMFDLSAASNFLKTQGLAFENQFLVGASIGANLSLKFLSENNKIKAAVLVSPGLDYRGILIEPFVDEKISDKIILVATVGDSYSYRTTQIIGKKSEKIKMQIYPGESHGTDILREHQQATEEIINWLKEKLI